MPLSQPLSEQGNPYLIQVFCKPPIPGDVKTRLIPTLGEQGACDLYTQMTRHLLDCVKNLPAELWVTEPHPFFDQFDLPIHRQMGEDLGERMQTTLQSGLESAQRVVLVGTDCPPINADYLTSAIEALATHDMVLGPAEDGGYGLVGVQRQVPDIFSGIPWSTDKVLSETCHRLNTLRCRYALLPTIWDVDVPADLPRFEAWRNQQCYDTPSLEEQVQ